MHMHTHAHAYTHTYTHIIHIKAIADGPVGQVLAGPVSK